MRRTLSHYLSVTIVDKPRPYTRTGADRALAATLTSILWISVLFMIFPAVDLAVSRWFTSGSYFVLAEQPFFKSLREIGLRGPVYIVSAMLLLGSLQIVLPRRWKLCPLYKPLFVVLSFAIGPVLIVETLKALIGRARPRHLLEYGGSAKFTPVWQFSGACAHNCSFPSGEAAAAAATLSLLIFVPQKLRWHAAAVLTPLLVAIALNRVLFGAHFLSDVMLAWFLTLLPMAWIWRWAESRSSS